jgi:hypothetical protein
LKRNLTAERLQTISAGLFEFVSNKNLHNFGVRRQSEATALWISFHNFGSAILQRKNDPKRRRRFALPPHSKLLFLIEHLE